MKRLLILLMLVIVMPSMSWALATTMEFGVRGAVSETGLRENYRAIEIYGQRLLPWRIELSPASVIYTRLDIGAGYMEAISDSGGWLAVGGDVVLSLLNGVWEVEVGWRPTFLFDHEFGNDDYGGPFQFSSHIGTTLNFGKANLSYRYQHISNAHIYKENPGLDLHMVGLGMRF